MRPVFSALLIVIAATVSFSLLGDCFAASLEISGAGPETMNTGSQEYAATIALRINADDGTPYYLRGVFAKENSHEYCGATWNGTNWFSGPYSNEEGWKQFLPVTIASGSATATLKMRPDEGNSPCRESGQYIFKVQRFTQSGSGSFDDQEEKQVTILLPTVVISVTPTHAKSPTTTPKPSKPVSIPTTKMPSETKKEPEQQQMASTATPVRNNVLAAESTAVSTPEGTVIDWHTEDATGNGKTVLVEGQKSGVPGVLLGIGIVCIGFGSAWGYFAFLRMRKKQVTGQDL